MRDKRTGNGALHPPGASSQAELPEEEFLNDPSGNTLLRRLLLRVLDRGEGGFHIQAVGDEVQVEDLDGTVIFRGGRTWHTILLDRLGQLAGLERAARGVVQRGRFAFGRGAEPRRLFRLSVLRGVAGEQVQVRIMPPENPPKTLESLGFRPDQAMALRQRLARPGLVWVTGPSEEGLASTLFSLLREIPGRGRTVTIEEEVFYRSEEFLQVETLNLTASGRRDLLRELKYLEFERIVVDRAGAGSLGDLLALAIRNRWVLAAAPAASLTEALADLVARARDLPLFGLNTLIHQRLVPLLCPECRVECVLGTAERELLSRWIDPDAPVYREGDGCPACEGRGVVGTRGFFEVLPVDERLRDALYRASWGEGRVEDLMRTVSPTLREQIARAVSEGGVGLTEFWEIV